MKFVRISSNFPVTKVENNLKKLIVTKMAMKLIPYGMWVILIKTS